MRFARYSKADTKAAGFKDRRSKIGIRADGTFRYDLAGVDKSALRDRVFHRDFYTCVDAKVTKNRVDDRQCSGPLEMSHEPAMSKSEGSDEEKSCFCRCRFHHRKLDNNYVKFKKTLAT